MNLFISYHRSDSTSAANRVRLLLQQRFDADAVFIAPESSAATVPMPSASRGFVTQAASPKRPQDLP